MLGASKRHFSLALALFFYFTIVYFSIKKLTGLPTSLEPSLLLVQISLALAALFFSLILSWVAFGWSGLNIFYTAALGLIVFVCVTASTPVFLWTAVFLTGFMFVLVYLTKSFENESVLFHTDLEKIQDQLNDLQVSYKLRGEGISVFFEKYSTYYNLRKLAEDLARMLSIDEVTHTLVDQAFRFISRGNYCAITLAETERGKLP